MHPSISLFLITALLASASPLIINPRQSYIPFCSGSSCPWTSNLMLVPNNIATEYKYMLSLQNVASTTYQVKCFNKYCSDGQLAGWFGNPTCPPLTFTMAPGETKSLAVEPDSHFLKEMAGFACAWAPGISNFPLTQYGQIAAVWAEVQFGSPYTQDWTGADCSSLVAQYYDFDVPGCQLYGGGVYSKIWPGATASENAYTEGLEMVDGIGLNVAPGNVTILATVGFS